MQGRKASETRFERYSAVKFVMLVFVFSGMQFLGCVGRAFAETGSGTVISNTATITFSDANSNGFTTTSNTVSTTIQNAPALTVTAPVNQNISPGMYVVDTFSLANTGNGSGTFAVVGADTTFGGTASGTTLQGYVLNGASSGTCSIASPCTASSLNAQSGMAGIAANGTVTVGVEYATSSGAAGAQTVQTMLGANLSYASVSGGPAEVSPDVSATATDTVKTDARLDVQASATIPSGAGANITWTITANNGGGYAAQGLASAKTLVGASNNGIILFLPIPAYNGTYLQLQAQPASPTLSGASGGAAATVYYNASSCSSKPTINWSTTYSATAECLALYVANASASVLPSAASQSNGVGSVTTPQISFSFSTNQPSGAGASSANAVTLIVSSAIGGTPWATSAVPIIGQGIVADGSTDAASASLIGNIEANTTSSQGTTSPGGASNQAGSQGYGSYTLFNGPYGVPAATGWYPGATGTAAADTMHDFTAYGVPCTSNGGSGVNGSSCTVSANNIIVNTLQNAGTLSDTIQLTAVAPAGWTVQLYNTSSCSGGGSSWPSCTQGSPITSASSAGGSVSGTVTVASSATLNYEAVYNATGNSATPFTAYTAKITAAGQSGAGTGADSNDTYNTLYPGSVIQTTASVTVTTSNCPSGMTPVNAGACPGGTLTYAIAYVNVVPASTGSNLGSEPAFAYGALYTNAGSAVLTDDGTAGTNNWATYTSGVGAAAVDTTSGTIFTYYPSGSTTFSTGQTKLTAKIGGNSYQIPPGYSGTVSFSAVVK